MTSDQIIKIVDTIKASTDWDRVTNTEPESDVLALFYFSETDEMEYGCIKNLKNKNTPTFYCLPYTPKEILWKRLEENLLL